MLVAGSMIQQSVMQNMVSSLESLSRTFLQISCALSVALIKIASLQQNNLLRFIDKSRVVPFWCHPILYIK